jgi:hypothetical protein
MRTGSGVWITDLGVENVIEVSPTDPSASRTAREIAAIAAFVEEVRVHARRWEDPAVALADGFIHLRIVGTEHWMQPDHLRDGITLDPRRPESVIFDPATMKLLGVMFVAPWGTNGFDLGGPPVAWHYHAHGPGCWNDLIPIDAPPQQVGSSLRCSAGTLRNNTPQMLHVWLPGVRSHPLDSVMEPPT